MRGQLIQNSKLSIRCHKKLNYFTIKLYMGGLGGKDAGTND
jgi:hypothetical protein